MWYGTVNLENMGYVTRMRSDHRKRRKKTNIVHTDEVHTTSFGFIGPLMEWACAAETSCPPSGVVFNCIPGRSIKTQILISKGLWNCKELKTSHRSGPNYEAPEHFLQELL